MSTTTKHTPGPLRAVAATYSGDHAIKDASGHIVAECFEAIRSAFECSHEEAKANATLYATAPEMLDLIKVSIGNVKSLGPAGALDALPTPYREWLAQLEAIYAKATGSAS